MGSIRSLAILRNLQRPRLAQCLGDQVHQRLTGPNVHARCPLHSDGHRAHPLAPPPEEEVRLPLLLRDTKLGIHAIGFGCVLAADHDHRIGVADPTPHPSLPAVRHLPVFGSRSDAEAGTSSLRLFEEPIAQVEIVVDVEAQEDPDAGRLADFAQIVPCERKTAVCIDSV